MAARACVSVAASTRRRRATSGGRRARGRAGRSCAARCRASARIVAGELEAVHARHVEVEDDDVVRGCRARRRAIALERGASSPALVVGRASPSARAARRRIRRLVALSSTTRTRSASRPRAPATRRGRVRAEPPRTAAVNQNVLPRPASLSTPISPPISSTSWRADREAEAGAAVLGAWSSASACENGSNSRDCSSGAMPMPVSVTSNRSTGRSRSSGRASADARPRPRSVNFTAFADEVDEHLAEARPGRRDTQRRHVGAVGDEQLEPLRCAPLGEQRDAALEHAAQVEVDRLELELAGLDLREVEDVVDDREQARRPGRCRRA